MTVPEYAENSIVDLEIQLRSCLAQLRTFSDKATFFSHMIRLADDNPAFRAEYRDKLTQLMEKEL